MGNVLKAFRLEKILLEKREKKKNFERLQIVMILKRSITEKMDSFLKSLKANNKRY